MSVVTMPAIFWQPARTDFRFLRGSCSNKVGEHGSREERRRRRRRRRKRRRKGTMKKVEASQPVASSVPFLIVGGRNPVDNGQKFPCLPPRERVSRLPENSTVLWGRINNAAWYRGIIARRREESLVEPAPFQRYPFSPRVRYPVCNSLHVSW